MELKLTAKYMSTNKLRFTTSHSRRYAEPGSHFFNFEFLDTHCRCHVVDLRSCHCAAFGMSSFTSVMGGPS